VIKVSVFPEQETSARRDGSTAPAFLLGMQTKQEWRNS
jgi:hypothetical protein